MTAVDSRTVRRASRPIGFVRGTLLQLRKRRGLFVLVTLLSVGAMVVGWGIATIIHLSNTAKHPAVGGTDAFAGSMAFLALCGLVVGACVGATASADDLSSGVFRDLVLTGRPRRALYFARIPAGCAFLAPFAVLAVVVAGLWSQAWPHHHGVPSFDLIWSTAVYEFIHMCFWYVLTLGVGALIGSRGFSITAVLAFALVVSNIVDSISALGRLRYALPSLDIARFAPHALRSQMTNPAGAHVPFTTAWIACCVWIVVIVGAGLWRTARRDA